MHLRLDHHSGEPIYRQIIEQVKYGVASGQLSPGEQLPSIRELAGQLKINPRTVVKVYQQLQDAGLVVKNHGQGVFISACQSGQPRAARKKVLIEMAQRLLAEASRLGADTNEVLDVINSVADQMETRA